MMRVLTMLAALCLTAGAAGQAPIAESRAPSTAEQAAFHAYYQARYPDDHAAQPRFVVTRAAAGAPWRVGAVVDARARRGARNLCRMRRIEFVFDKAWRALEPERQLVWLQAGACAAPAPAQLAHLVELVQRMPDADVIALLASQARMLPRARLIMAGNSSCASARSFAFSLAALDVAPLPGTAEEMATLVYRSDRGTSVRVWLRKSGAELDAWNVSCAAAPL